MNDAYFTLLKCGICDCTSSAFSVQIDGEGGGLRITDSSNSVWRTVDRIEPGDPRYRDCLAYLQCSLEGPHAAEAQRYLKALPKITEEELVTLEAKWIQTWAEQPLYALTSHARYRMRSRVDRNHQAGERLQEAGIKTCGALLQVSRTQLVKENQGVGTETGWAIHNAFAAQRLSWDKMRQIASGC